MREDDIARIVHRSIDESPRIHRIESDISTLKSGVQGLETESLRKGVLMEAMQTDIRKIIEVVMHINQRMNETLGFREIVKRHSDRLMR